MFCLKTRFLRKIQNKLHFCGFSREIMFFSAFSYIKSRFSVLEIVPVYKGHRSLCVAVKKEKSKILRSGKGGSP